MLEACEQYPIQAHENRPLMQLFVFWFVVHEPDLFLSDFQKKVRDVLQINRLTQMNKRQFFDELLPAMSKIEASAA